MKQKNKIELYNTALNNYGIISQQYMLFEEIGELQNAIAKAKRGRSTKEDIITELADVYIMVEQMAFFYGWKDFLKEKEFKLNRLKERLKKAVQ